MKIHTLVLLIIISTSQVAQSQCSPKATNIYSFTYSGNNYEIIKEKLNWIDASACAVNRGGKLAEINSQAEQDTLFLNINNAGILASNTVAPDGGGASYLWLGGNDLSKEGNWVWDGNNDGVSTQFSGVFAAAPQHLTRQDQAGQPGPARHAVAVVTAK